jgi:hypothetical protein
MLACGDADGGAEVKLCLNHLEPVEGGVEGEDATVESVNCIGVDRIVRCRLTLIGTIIWR